MGGPVKPRTQYKGVWNERATTEDRAKMTVIGLVEEKDLRRAGFHSIGLQERPGWIEAYGTK